MPVCCAEQCCYLQAESKNNKPLLSSLTQRRGVLNCELWDFNLDFFAQLFNAFFIFILFELIRVFNTKDFYLGSSYFEDTLFQNMMSNCSKWHWKYISLRVNARVDSGGFFSKGRIPNLLGVNPMFSDDPTLGRGCQIHIMNFEISICKKFWIPPTLTGSVTAFT